MRGSANRRQSPPIRLARLWQRRAKALGDLLGVEAKARPGTGAKAPCPELVGVVVDPAPAEAPPLRDLRGAEQARRQRLSLRHRLLGDDQLGEAFAERLDRLDRSTQLDDLLGFVRIAHRLLAKGRLGLDPFSAASLPQCSIRAAAISI